MKQQSDALYSFVSPLRNAELWVQSFITELTTTLKECGVTQYEIILVDDASTDATVAIVQRLQQHHENIQLYCLSRQMGSVVAFVAGLDNSIGDFVLTFDPAIDPVSEIPNFLAKAANAEIVFGIRSDDTGSSAAYRFLSGSFYKLYRRLTGINIPGNTSHYRCYARSLVNHIVRTRDRHETLKILPSLVVSSWETQSYQPVPRAGASWHSPLRTSFSTGLTLLLTTSSAPLRLMIAMLILSSGLSLGYAIYVVLVALFKRNVAEGWISLALPLSVITFLLSASLAILAEYVYRIARDSRDYPVYYCRMESLSSVIRARQQLNVDDGTGELATDTPTRVAGK